MKMQYIYRSLGAKIFLCLIISFFFIVIYISLFDFSSADCVDYTLKRFKERQLSIRNELLIDAINANRENIQILQVIDRVIFSQTLETEIALYENPFDDTWVRPGNPVWSFLLFIFFSILGIFLTPLPTLYVLSYVDPIIYSGVVLSHLALINHDFDKVTRVYDLLVFLNVIKD